MDWIDDEMALSRRRLIFFKRSSRYNCLNSFLLFIETGQDASYFFAARLASPIFAAIFHASLPILNVESYSLSDSSAVHDAMSCKPNVFDQRPEVHCS